ncbi:MAG: ASPIC/UnbV domain-containing protein [Flavobacteriales bacterium]|nr:ASPIC/UnbV domain-containing protein [Flavobacteriales bacterium]
MIGASSFSQGGHKLMRNDGTIFTDVTIGSGYDVFTGTSIEHAAHDFNNDGWIDIMSGNSIMRNNGDMTFTQFVAGPGSGGIGDLNNDGFLDVQNNNVSWINSGNENHWVRINTVGTVSNSNGIGARIEIVTASGTQIREVRSGDGFRYMSSLMAHFGLGADEAIDQITVYWPSGIVNTIQSPAIDTVLTIVEEVSTSLTAPKPAIDLVVYPVPATDQLFVMGTALAPMQPVVISSLLGQQVISTTMQNGRLDISALPSGVYQLELRLDGRTYNRKFVKQ